MTTERRPAKREVDVAALHLYVVAALAATYLVAWWAFTPGAPAATPAEPTVATPVPAARARATADVASVPARVRPPAITRRAPARRVRVRTRSS